ncbi:MAG TPA: hypothetical protein V6C78_27935 [Crinalium sp.]
MILLIPISYIISYTIVGNQKGPYYWTPNQDDYAYLLDSLNLVNSNPATIFQDPGIPVQILGAATILIAYPIQALLHQTTGSLNESVLAHPELYLSFINDAFLGVTAIALLAVGIISVWLTKNSLFSLILQSTPLIVAVSILKNDPSRISPESLILCISQLLVIWLIVYLYRDKVERSPWFAACFGLIFGLGLATKLFFLPMAVFLLLVPGFWRKGIALAATVLVFVMGTLPAGNKFEQFGNEFVNVILPSSNSGNPTGSPGFIGWLENLNILISNNPAFFSVVTALTLAAIAIAILSRHGRGILHVNLETQRTQKLLFLSGLVAIASWLQVALTTQDYFQSQFLMPAIGLAGLMAFATVQLCLVGLARPTQTVIDTTSLTEFVLMIAVALCIAIGIHQTYSASQYLLGRYNLRYTEAKTIADTIQHNQGSENCAIALYKRASTVESALKYAELRTDEPFGAILDRLYPNTIFYSEDSKIYESFAQRLTPAQVLKPGQTCVLFRTNPLIGRRSKLKNSEELQKVFIGKTEVVYRINP